MTTPDAAVAALAEALEPIARDVREWSRIKAVHDINTTGAAKMILAHLPAPFAIVDMRAVASMLHEERLKHGTCGDHTEGYDDHMEWHEAEARCLLAEAPR